MYCHSNEEDVDASNNTPSSLCNHKKSDGVSKPQINSSDESNNVPDTTTNDIESNTKKAKPSLSKSECKVFVPSNANTTERKTIEAAGIVIKKDYLPSVMKVIKVEKTREDVTRVLNYDTEPVSNRMTGITSAINDKSIEEDQIEPENVVSNIKTEPNTSDGSIAKISDDKPIKKPSLKVNISEDKENSTQKNETPKKIEIKIEPNKKSDLKSSESNHEKKDKQSNKDRHPSNHHRHHSSKTSSSKSSSRRSSSSSNRECSRCYRRSKLKRLNVGIQCHKYGEPFKQMTPSATPLKFTKNLACNMTDSLYSDLKYGRFFHIEVHTNGGASIVHMYQDELDSLTDEQLEELTEEFFRIVFSEDENGFAHHVMGIVHDAANYIPDLLEHFADNYSTLTVKAGVLGRNSDIETSTMAQYYEQVEKNYSHGTFRYGPLHQISLVGKVHEEVGGYFPDLLGRLEQNPFLKKVNLIVLNYIFVDMIRLITVINF